MKQTLKQAVKSLSFKPKANLIGASIINESIRKLGKNHEDFLMSQKIDQLPTKQNAQEFKKNYGLDIVNEDDLQLAAKGEKDIDYKFSNQQYIDSFNAYKHGRVNVFDYKDTHMTLVGTNYHNLPLKNIYKLLTNTQPDLILLQIRPDQLLDNFKICTNSSETGYFSSTLYAQQVIRTGFEVMPRANLRLQIKKNLKENNILLASIKERDQDYYQNVYKKTILESKNKDYYHLERLSDEAIAVACFYAERNNIPVVLVDQPEQIFRQNIANTHTLMQLQNAFTRAARYLGQNPDTNPQTPLAMSYQIFPELFLSASDKYMSTLIEYLIATQKYKRMTAFLGQTQSESIHQYLLQRDISHLADELYVHPPKGSIIRDLTPEEIIEKHALLDAMYYGIDVLENLDLKQFKTSYLMIDRYADVEKIDQQKKLKMKYLHFELLKKYAKFAKKEFLEGKEILKKEFILRMGH
ncbi:hypothetical protein ABPG72_013213 [Tetrahymena utriculariae]